jgi:uncharacterized protein with HEPN domain
MSDRRDRDYITDICEAIERITSYTNGISFQQFLNDNKLRMPSFEIFRFIGEASKKVSVSLKNANKAIPWKKLAGVCDKVVHFYFGIVHEIVWEISTIQLPALLPQLNEILKRPDRESK